MPGIGDSSSTTTSSSSTKPWDPAIPTVNALLGKLNPLIENSGVTPQQTQAINQLTAMGQAGNPYAPAVGQTATDLLQGGGATNELGRVNQAYDQYVKNVSPLASNTNYDPMATPGLGDVLSGLRDSITGQVNGMFAASGRDASGYNQKALGQGLTQGLAPVLVNQFNANRTAQQDAADRLYGAGNTTATTAAGMNQTANTNKVAGIGAAEKALDAQTWGPKEVITAQTLGQSLPAQTLGLLAQIGIPIAGLGTNSSGTSTTEKSASPLEVITGLSSALGSASGGGGKGGGGSGILALLGML